MTMNSTNNVKPVPSKRTPGAQSKLLVVDDDARLRDLLRRFFADNGAARCPFVSLLVQSRGTKLS